MCTSLCHTGHDVNMTYYYPCFLRHNFTFLVLSEESYFHLCYVGFTLLSFLFPFCVSPFSRKPSCRVQMYKSLWVPVYGLFQSGGEAGLHDSQ